MTAHTSTGKTTRKTTDRLAPDSSAGLNAVALAPPACGIDFVDRGMPAAPPIQYFGRQAEPALQRELDGGTAEALPPRSNFSPNRTGLPDHLKAGIELLSGIDLSEVRVHTNSDQPAQLSALAYARGNDIHVGPGHEQHLPHEAWHVVQQAQGRVQPTMQTKEGIAINDDKELEREADVMGRRAANVMAEGVGRTATHGPAHGEIASVNTLTQTKSGLRGRSNPIQMYNWTYGSLTQESGTEVKTDIIAPGDTGGGSNVSAWPSWWPTGGAETANDFLRENFVQGHLLNQKLGGPGNDRRNLTPITRSTNSQMSASIENLAKGYLANNQAISYWISADYKSHPNVADVGAGHLNAGEQKKLQTDLDKMPSQIGAQITVYDNKGVGKWAKAAKQPKDIYVKNEGAALKGSFV